MTARARVLAVLIGAFLAVQLAVPTLALFGPRPSRFGWHMYSALPPVPAVWAVRADGSEERIDLGALFAVQRAEIDYSLLARSALCERLDAAVIRVKVTAGSPIEEVECP